MPKAITDYIKKQATPMSIGFSALGNIDDLTSADHKLRGILKTLRDIAIWPVMLQASFAKLFGGMQKSIRSLVHDTGSLEAALKKLSKIQELQKVFTPLVGGAKAAKVAVAELVNFAASRNLKLDSVAEARKNLDTMARGALAGTKNLSLMADAAAGTAGNLAAVTEASIELVETMQGGGSIEGSARQLHNMGAISLEAADNMIALQRNGAKVSEVVAALQGSLASFAGEAEASKDSIEGVNAAYEKAKQSLQEAFGSPFVASDVENTKNWTAAMVAVAPAVKMVAEHMSALIGGMGTGLSSLAKWASTVPGLATSLGGLVNVLGRVVAGVSALATVSLAAWLITGTGAVLSMAQELITMTGAVGLAATAIKGFALAVRIAMGATGIGLLILLVIAAYTAFTGFKSKSEDAQKAMKDLEKGTKDLNKALEKQKEGVDDLTKSYQALRDIILKTAEDEQALHDQEVEQLMAKGGPSDRVSILDNEIEALERKSKAAREGVEARAEYSAAMAAGDTGGAEMAEMSAPPGSSLHLRWLARQSSGSQRESFETQAQMAEALEGKAGQLQSKLSAARAKRNQESANVTRGRYREEAEDVMQRAEAEGGTGSGAGNALMVAEKYESLRAAGYGHDDAQGLAADYANRAISIKASNAGLSVNSSAAASEMARIGGGGGIEAASGSIDVLKEQLEMQEDMRDYLEIIAGSGGSFPLK